MTVTVFKDGEFLYITPLAARRLWRVPTAALKVRPSSANPNAFVLAQQMVQEIGEMGSHANGLESDDQGFIYLSAPGEGILWRVGCDL